MGNVTFARSCSTRSCVLVLVGVSWLFVGCSTADTSLSQADTSASTGGSSTSPALSSSSSAGPSHTSSPTTTPSTTTTLPPTTTTIAPTTTLAPGPPVYDPQTLGNHLELPSFVFTVTVDNTNGGQLSKNITTIGYVQEPTSMYRLATFSYDDVTDGTRSYLVGGRTYVEDQFRSWFLYEAGSRDAPQPANDPNIRSSILGGVVTAQLVGQEDYAGVPSNHFVFNETNLASYASYTPENPSPTVVGDFYLAQVGNYVLYAHSRETSPGRVYEVTEAMTSVGQVANIELPAELAPMAQALDLGVGLTALLPPGSSLSTMVRYSNGIGVDYYRYITPVKGNDELVDFYRTSPTTGGWTVAHVGHIAPHLEQVNCETRVECVMLRNGGEQIVISFAGTIIVEYDHRHIFSPA